MAARVDRRERSRQQALPRPGDAPALLNFDPRDIRPRDAEGPPQLGALLDAWDGAGQTKGYPWPNRYEWRPGMPITSAPGSDVDFGPDCMTEFWPVMRPDPLATVSGEHVTDPRAPGYNPYARARAGLPMNPYAAASGPVSAAGVSRYSTGASSSGSGPPR